VGVALVSTQATSLGMTRGIGVILVLAQTGTPALATSSSSPGRSSYPPPITSLTPALGPAGTLLALVGPSTTLTAL
jgi:hypothetical protein